MALQTKYPSPLAGYCMSNYGYGMSNYGLPQVSADTKFPYFNFGQNESLHSAMGYACKYFLILLCYSKWFILMSILKYY